jgi:hypothetical protein
MSHVKKFGNWLNESESTRSYLNFEELKDPVEKAVKYLKSKGWKLEKHENLKWSGSSQRVIFQNWRGATLLNGTYPNLRLAVREMTDFRNKVRTGTSVDISGVFTPEVRKFLESLFKDVFKDVKGEFEFYLFPYNPQIEDWENQFPEIKKIKGRGGYLFLRWYDQDTDDGDSVEDFSTEIVEAQSLAEALVKINRGRGVDIDYPIGGYSVESEPRQQIYKNAEKEKLNFFPPRHHDNYEIDVRENSAHFRTHNDESSPSTNIAFDAYFFPGLSSAVIDELNKHVSSGDMNVGEFVSYFKRIISDIENMKDEDLENYLENLKIYFTGLDYDLF